MKDIFRRFRTSNNDRNNELWLKRRTNAYYVYLMIFFMFGASTPDPTIWIYVSRLMHAHKKRLTYGLLNLTYTVTAIIFPAVAARYTDQFRRIKLLTIILNIVAIGGCILYIIPIDPVFPILGRLFIASQTALRPLIIGEIARTYDRDDINTKIGTCILFENIGKGVGPLLTMAFTNLETLLFGIRVNYGNVTGLVSFVLFTLLLVFTCILHHDVSNEHDIRWAEEQRVRELLERKGDTDATPSSAIQRMFTHPDTLLVLNITFWSSLWRQTGYRVIAIIVLHTLRYQYASSNVCHIVYFVVTVMISFLYNIHKSKKHLFYYGLASLISLIIFSTCLRIIYKKFSFAENMVLLTIFVIMLAVNKVAESYFSVVTFVNLMHQNQLCFGSSVQDGVSKIGLAIAELYSAYIYKNIIDVYILIMVTTVICIIALILRKRSLDNIKPVI